MQYLPESPASCHFPQTKLQTKPRESGGKYQASSETISHVLTQAEVAVGATDPQGAGLWFAPLNPAFFRVSAEKGRVK